MTNDMPLKINKKVNFNRVWFIEGLFYSTFIALLWSNEEPSKINTLLVSWTSYAIVSIALFGFVKRGIIFNPSKWIRVYFIQCFLFLIVCDFIWLQGHIPRTTADAFDTIRFDAYSVQLAESGMDPASVVFQNYTGTIWYAGFIYYIFGISKFYVALFNSVLAFIACGLFVSIMGKIEGNLDRWQWLRFGMLIPDFIFHFPSVSKEPLSTFFVAVGIWLVTKFCFTKKKSSIYFILLIITTLFGFAVRAAVLGIIFIITVIFYINIVKNRRKWVVSVFIIGSLLSSLLFTRMISTYTGGMGIDWVFAVSRLVNSESRLDIDDDIILPRSGSWNVITESTPSYLMPIIAPVKGFFMMIAPPPVNFNLYNVIVDVSNSKYDSKILHNLFIKMTSLMFIISFPFLFAATFDIFKQHRVLWFIFPFTFFVLIAFMGFAVAGTIQPRYRPMLLLYCLVTSGIGYYYGKPKNYILPTVSIVLIGAVIYQIPKIL